tara:strand:- start:12244 stop:13323 length:1080 start_codon:yes stop_codon:yes gene_type:complete
MTEDKIFTAIGLMSGTSLDGVDIALLKSDGVSIMSIGPFDSVPYQARFKQRLFNQLGQVSVPKALEEELTLIHANVICDFMKINNISKSDIDVIGFHGQTIYHNPKEKLTFQIGDGCLLAKLLDLKVVNNFRLSDVENGGQGAPLVPIYHQTLAKDIKKPLAIINIGGVSNVTFIGNQELIAFDTGPGNAPLDDIVFKRLGLSFDKNGEIAQSGVINKSILKKFLSHSFFARPPPKTLDRNSFNYRDLLDCEIEDALATVIEFIAKSISKSQDYFPQVVDNWYVSGGGSYNITLMKAISEALNFDVFPVNKLGWNADALEAQAFAFLAVRSLLGMPISFPNTTGVSKAMTGGVINIPPR